MVRGLAHVAVAALKARQIQTVDDIVDHVRRVIFVQEVAQRRRQQEGLLLVVGSKHIQSLRIFPSAGKSFSDGDFSQTIKIRRVPLRDESRARSA
jgi:hypothetical protein